MAAGAARARGRDLVQAKWRAAWSAGYLDVEDIVRQVESANFKHSEETKRTRWRRLVNGIFSSVRCAFARAAHTKKPFAHILSQNAASKNGQLNDIEVDDALHREYLEASHFPGR